MADILVVALSARSLAQSARAAGFAPLAADFFGDLDLQDAAEANVRIEGDIDTGFAWEALIEALERVAARRQPVGIVCGTGFEDRPELLDRLATRWPLLGNAAATVARVKDPAQLAAVCAKLRIPHPGWSDVDQGDGWLSKRRGASGGTHVDEERARSLPPCGGGSGRGESRAAAVPPKTGHYWQERVEGEPVSALVLGAGRRALVLGLSRQRTDPTPDAPFRYGGAVQPAGLAQWVAAELTRAAESIAQEFKLLGLNSVDFLVGPQGWHLIEVNPRPGATLDIFEPEDGRLFRIHVEACRGELPLECPSLKGAAAAAIVYAKRGIASVPRISWPDWTADRQPPGSCVEAGAPLCTVVAHADTADAARRLVDERTATIRAALEAG